MMMIKHMTVLLLLLDCLVPHFFHNVPVSVSISNLCLVEVRYLEFLSLFEVLIIVAYFVIPGVCLSQITSHGNGIPQIRVYRSHHRPGGGGRWGPIRFQRLLEREVANSGGCQLHGQHQDFGNGVRKWIS